MKRRQHEELLKDIFADEGIEALREESLRRGLAAVRAKRRMSAVGWTTSSVAVATLVLAALWWRQLAQTEPVVVASTAHYATPVLKIYPAPSPSNAPAVQTISDDELLALFPHQAVGLIGKPGEQKLVFFGPSDNATD